MKSLSYLALECFPHGPQISDCSGFQLCLAFKQVVRPVLTPIYSTIFIILLFSQFLYVHGQTLMNKGHIKMLLGMISTQSILAYSSTAHDAQWAQFGGVFFPFWTKLWLVFCLVCYILHLDCFFYWRLTKNSKSDRK